MVSNEISSNQFTDDIIDFIVCLHKYNVKYVVVGGQAVIYYGHSRLTGDIDFYYDRSEPNCERMFLALSEFWEGDIPEIANVSDLMQKDLILQYGVPPNRIDLISETEEFNFNKIWENREKVNLKLTSTVLEINFIGLDYLIKFKKQAGRPRDLEDLEFLRALKNSNKI